MNHNLAIVFSIFLLVGIIVPVYAQTISDNVVINEVDINPPLNDALGISEWAELYNPTDSDVSLAGWEIASTTVLKKTKTLSPGTIIKPGQFLTFYHENSWFTDSNEVIELRDANGNVIDKTPALTDTTNDFKSWQLIYDGYGSDNIDDWKFVPPTPGSSNGKLIETQDDDEIFVTITSDKSSYLMDDNAIISGSVSEEVYIHKPFFAQATINVNISGPNYYKTLTLYPDRDLNFATMLKLQQVLGANEGIYDVSVDYAGVTANTSFSVGFELIAQEKKEDSEISITTDKSQYIPGDTVTIIGTTTEVSPFEGMKITVKDNADTLIHAGTLHPSLDRKAPSSASTTNVYIDNISPNYGFYTINAEYFGKSVSTTFEVIVDVKEDVPISVWTDKKAYAIGEEVNITGRLNKNYVSTLDLKIEQTTQTSSGHEIGFVSNTFKSTTGVTVLGDYTFSHTFKIPESENRLGDYRIDVRKNIGSATVIIHVVEDPENFVEQTAPLTFESDKDVYTIGDTITFTGFILNPFENQSYGTAADVSITFTYEDGRPLEIVVLPKGAKTRAHDGIVVGYHFTAIPETSGKFTLLLPVTQGAIAAGEYVVRAEYQRNVVFKTITVIDPLEGITLADGNAEISFDKDAYGLNETVHLSGIIPPTGDYSVKIFLTRPDGTSSTYGATVDNQRFSWSWNTPRAEKTQFLTSDDVRFERPSNFGTYTVRLSTDTLATTLYFKISKDPENDSVSTIPLAVSTDKSLYQAGEKLQIIGTVFQREQGSQGLVVPERVGIKILDGTFPFKLIPGYEATVYPDAGGTFLATFDLPITIFSEGPYTVKTLYSNSRAESTFGVANDFVISLDEPVSLLLGIDKTEYFPGDTVTVHGKPNKLVYVKKINVNTIKISDSDIDCRSLVQVDCGNRISHGTSYLPGPDGSFTHEFVIPNSISSVGNYKVSAEVGFDTAYVQFNVVEETPTLRSNIFIDKENRIPDKTIPIITRVKTIDGVDFDARVLSGSLITPSRGDESDVNLKVSFPPNVSPVKNLPTPETGVCIIGPDADCLVRESTRRPGQIYDVVEIQAIEYYVRYSGPDVRLEKFSILPVNSEFLPDAIWNVEVIKDDQVSRFYYKITYKTPDQSRYNPLPFE